MEITFFGFVWLIITLGIFLRQRTKEMITLLFVAMTFQQPAVIRFGDTGIGPQVITSCAYIIFYAKKNNWKIRIDRKNKAERMSRRGCLFLILCILSSFCFNGREVESEHWWIYFLQLCIYIICFLLMWGVRDVYSLHIIKEAFSTTIKVVSLIGVIQFLNTMRAVNITPILQFLFYNNTDMGLRVGDRSYPWSMPRLYATFQEPSYCSAFLVGAFFFLIAYSVKNKKDYFWIGLVLLELILTFSSTAYGAFVVCGICYLIISKNKKILRILLPLAVICLCILMASGSFMRIINDVILTKLDITKSGSAWERNSWNEKALLFFKDSPILGIGYKNCRASYFIYSVLGQLGICGLVSWVMIWIRSLFQALKNRSDEDTVAISLFVLGVIIAMFVAIPDIDFCVFWLSMYLMALYLKRYRISH